MLSEARYVSAYHIARRVVVLHGGNGDRVDHGLEDRGNPGMWLLVPVAHLQEIRDELGREGFMTYHVSSSIAGQGIVVRERDVPRDLSPIAIDAWLEAPA